MCLKCSYIQKLQVNWFMFRVTCLFWFQFRNFKIVYRRYAGLYFCFCVDVHDNNLYYLEAIHNFVEVRVTFWFFVKYLFLSIASFCPVRLNQQTNSVVQVTFNFLVTSSEQRRLKSTVKNQVCVFWGCSFESHGNTVVQNSSVFAFT